MNGRMVRRFLLCACLAGLAGACAWAQKGPGGPPPGGVPPGGPGPMGAPMRGPEARPNVQPSGTRNELQFGPVGRWWDDKQVMQNVGLTRAQKKKMDAIFDANKPAIVSSYKTFLSEQAKLNKMSRDAKVDQARLFAQIDTVNQARSALEKATTQMLLQIRGQMDAGQIDRLQKLQ